MKRVFLVTNLKKILGHGSCCGPRYVHLRAGFVIFGSQVFGRGTTSDRQQRGSLRGECLYPGANLDVFERFEIHLLLIPGLLGASEMSINNDVCFCTYYCRYSTYILHTYSTAHVIMHVLHMSGSMLTFSYKFQNLYI